MDRPASRYGAKETSMLNDSSALFLSFEALRLLVAILFYCCVKRPLSKSPCLTKVPEVNDTCCTTREKILAKNEETIRKSIAGATAFDAKSTATKLAMKIIVWPIVFILCAAVFLFLGKIGQVAGALIIAIMMWPLRWEFPFKDESFYVHEQQHCGNIKCRVLNTIRNPLFCALSSVISLSRNLMISYALPAAGGQMNDPIIGTIFGVCSHAFLILVYLTLYCTKTKVDNMGLTTLFKQHLFACRVMAKMAVIFDLSFAVIVLMIGSGNAVLLLVESAFTMLKASVSSYTPIYACDCVSKSKVSPDEGPEEKVNNALAAKQVF